jgi:sulfur carrier protein
MDISVNGQHRAVAAGTTVAELVAGAPNRGIAVAVNGAVVPRGEHAACLLSAGDRVEIVTAVQGG